MSTTTKNETTTPTQAQRVPSDKKPVVPDGTSELGDGNTPFPGPSGTDPTDTGGAGSSTGG
jgi:hypothetical protein